jgi:gliding motility-associated-like protein
LPNSGCAPVKDTIQIDINPGPVVNIGPDITICKNMVHNFNPTVTPQQTYTYNWLPPASTAFLNSTTILNPTGTFTNVGVYPFVLVASPLAAGCDGFDTMTVTVLPNDFILTNQDTTICDGESVQVTIIGPNQFTYTWSPGAYVSNTGIKNPIITTPVPNTYNCTATYPGCPDMNHSFHINIEPVPQVSVGPDRTKCYYDTLRLEGVVLPDTFSQYIYAWTPTTNLNNSNTANVVFSGTTSTTYTLNVSTPIGCKGSDVVAITVFPKNLTTLFPSDTNMCPGNSVTLRANGAVSYLYQPGIFIADSTAAITVATPITEQTYTLYSIDANGCPDTDYAHIFVPDNAILNLGPDVTLYPGDDHQFNAFTNCSTFLWTPPSFLNYTNISNPTISNPTSSIQYTVLASNEFGCTSSDTITVYVIDESVITLPNAFSPGNGSSTNDNLKVQHLGNATLNHFRIFNRWGQLVFETTNINQGWNGRYKDVPQPMGTYVYQLQAITNKGKIINKQGNITLIR